MRKFIIAALLLGVGGLAYAGPKPLEISCGPWVTNVSENSVTILWSTAEDNLGWVEITSDTDGYWAKRDTKSCYQTFCGRRMYGKFHTVTIDGLTKGTKYCYRIYGKDLIDDDDTENLVFSEEKWVKKNYEFTTFDISKETCSFSCVNDMHMRTEHYRTLIEQTDVEKNDFVLLNGDIISKGNHPLDTILKYGISPVEEIAEDLPIMFAKGNHEGRGNNFQTINKVFPTSEPGKFYYTFREGPVAFIVLDAGETKTPVANSYSGEPCYEDYLKEELEWAEKAMREPEFAKAPVKVCISHVPLSSNGGGDEMDTRSWMSENFNPVLSKAGINLMISAHVHVHTVKEPGCCRNTFPIITNDNEERLQFDADAEHISLHTYNEAGQEAHAYEIRIK